MASVTHWYLGGMGRIPFLVGSKVSEELALTHIEDNLDGGVPRTLPLLKLNQRT